VSTPESTKEESYLTLGWEVTPTLEPRYWRKSDAKPGSQPASELVRVPADLMGSHTAIIAQSGSGKSFFLGRLIEELMLQTRSRCVVFDPNADFRKVYEPKLAKLWEKAAYDPPNRCDGLPHEASREEFATRW
jgi:hypothetical protein